MNELIASRWSPRAFDETAVVTPDEMRVLLEAARWAPSHGNSQPARFVLGYRGDDSYKRIFDTLRTGNQNWAGRASVLLLGVVITSDERGELPNTEYGLGLAMENLVLQAVDLGLITHQMGGFYKEHVREAFEMPEDVRPIVVVAIGRPGRVEDLPKDLQERERRERVRRPLTETVFTGRWGQSAF